MIIKGLSAINSYLAQQKADNFAAWSKRNGYPNIQPVRNYDDDSDYELETTGYQSPGAAADYFDIPHW